jgi:hypothetical protein
MKIVWLSLAVTALLGATKLEAAEPNRVEVIRDEKGFKLQVDGQDTMVFGMNWDYFPIGTTVTYSLWEQPDDFIEKALESEMTMMRDMGINTIRLYVGVPKKWIEHIYDKYGIYTVINHAMGRYGHFIDGKYEDPINYQNPRHREVLSQEIFDLVEEYKNTRGLMFWLLGNENNYGLYWTSDETEDLPEDERQAAKAQYLYSLYGEIIDGIHARDDNHPVAIANGDLQFIDLIQKHAPNLDIMGANVYRGYSSRDLFDEVLKKLNVPFVYTEFGSDAYNAKTRQEDGDAQAEYLRTLWQEIYEHAYGMGRAQNAIGGMIFQWTDGWWKTGMTEDLDVHNTKASWTADAYQFDYVEGETNMNEEWFGITAKAESEEEGMYVVIPRTAYYLLAEGFKLDPYEASSIEEVRKHWSRLKQTEADVQLDFATKADVSYLKQKVKELSLATTVQLRAEFETFATNGNNLTPEVLAEPQFDHLESFYVDFGVKPASNVSARVSINAVANIPTNPINVIFYENRGDADPEDLERFQIYQAEFDWDEKYFHLEGFFRTTHYHWGYEGDFFGIYPEANYPSVPFAHVEGVDTFNANAPNGMVFTGKKWFEGFKIAFGPELYWGANPGIMAKYYKDFGELELGLVHQEDFDQVLAGSTTSSVIPLPQTRKSAISLGYKVGKWEFKVGGLIAGTDRLAEDRRDFVIAREAEGPGNGFADSGYDILDDQIEFIDTLGSKAKLVYAGDPVSFYVQGAYKGLVADAGGDLTDTITGWTLDEVGQGNHYSVGGGLALQVGDFQIAPNMIYQVPLEGPLPNLGTIVDPETGDVFPGVTPRNQLDDPFWVRANREMLGGELLIAYDPTPATWMWTWDAERQEDAFLSGYIDFVYRHLPTSQDSGVGVLFDGVVFSFDGAPPARDLFEVKGRLILVPNPKTRFTIHAYGGTTQTTGSDPRLIERGGADLRLIYRKFDIKAYLKINDWGPYDFQRDFNLTFPVQVASSVSYGLKMPEWFLDVYTNLGVQFQYRSLDEFSDSIIDPTDPNAEGQQWELRTYVHIAI